VLSNITLADETDALVALPSPLILIEITDRSDAAVPLVSLNNATGVSLASHPSYAHA
jgi:hypothetical protein